MSERDEVQGDPERNSRDSMLYTARLWVPRNAAIRPR